MGGFRVSIGNLKQVVFALVSCCALAVHAAAVSVDDPDKARTVAVRTENVKGDFPDKDAWAKARTAQPFLVAGNVDVKRHNAFSALHDDKALYVRARVNNPKVNEKEFPREGRPGFRGVHGNDCIEIFLGSPDDPAAKVHLAVDALGQRYSNPEITWRSKVERDDNGYTVFIAVPFDALGWTAPERGAAWKIKVGHESKTGLGNSMWPANFSPDFHSDQAWAFLYFGVENLLTDGGFEEMMEKRGRTWSFCPGGGKTPVVGAMEIVKSPLPDGGHAVRMTKTEAQPSWWPFLMYTPRLNLRKGRSYVASAWVRTDKPWVLRVYFHKNGVKMYIKALRIKQEASPDAMRYFEVPFVMPEEADTSYPGVRFANAETGSLTIDNFVVREAPSARNHEGEREGVSHPIHNLIELATRGRILPPALREPGLTEWPCEKLVYKDTATGATIWKMTRWPGYSRHHYANMLCWNANGALVKLLSNRSRNVLMASDGRRMFKLDVPDADYITKWCPVRPERLYAHEYRGDKRVFYMVDVVTKKKRYLPGVYGGRADMWVPHPDGKRLIIVDNSASPTAETSHGYVIDPDTGEVSKFDFGGVTHQVWFTKRKDYLIGFGYEGANKYFTKERHGQWLIGPDGTGLRKVADPKWGHCGYSPDGKEVAFHGVNLRVADVMTGKDRQVSSNSGGHATWMVTPEWFVSSTTGVLRCVGAKGQGFEYVLCHSRFQSPFGNFSGRERPCSSWDGTKVAYSSSMMGDWDFYNVISRLPGAPRQVRCRVQGAGVEIAWQPPQYHKETQGYFVYRATESGGPYRQVNGTPLPETRFTDPLPPGTSRAFYVVTSVEHCGLEGRYSEEACASADGAWQGPVRWYYEMEDCRPAPPLMESLDPSASNMYVMRMDREHGGKARLRVNTPAAREYVVWLRAKSDLGDCRVTLTHQDMRWVSPEIRCSKYEWKRLGVARLPKGETELALEVQGKRARLDALFLTDAGDDRPRDDLLWDVSPPARPSNVHAERVGLSHVELRWDPVKDVDVSHYDLYAGRKPGVAISQKRLVASPIESQYVDWGLHLATEYSYRVCAVDRRGNVSAPSEEIACRTLGAAPPIVVRGQVGAAREGLPAADSSIRKRLEETGALAVRAHRLAKSTPLSMELDVPSDGEYALWVKYGVIEGRGPVAIRIGEANQAMHVGGALNYIDRRAGVFVWEAAKAATGGSVQTRVLKLSKGRLSLALTTQGDSRFEVAEVMLTNDLGLLPDGIHCYRPGNPEWLKE